MKPEPKVAKTVCTLCGLDWDMHGDEPTAETCVELLRAELARRPAFPIQGVSATSATLPWYDWYRSSILSHPLASDRAAKAQ